MEILNKESKINFLGKRNLAMVISAVLLLICIVAILTRGMNFGLDFTGGTLVEVGYESAVEIENVRDHLTEAGFEDAVVQHFGTSKDVLIRLPSEVKVESQKASEISSSVMSALRAPSGEELLDQGGAAGAQQCLQNGQTANCQLQMRRVEFVGPQVGDELKNQGALAMLYAMIGILIYVTFRFKWHFALGSVIALVHDVLITVGLFAIFQFEFSLAVLAAVLAVVGYSLNDTIVVYDRIRENFVKMRKGDRVTVINRSINQTLPRTILTSLTTFIVVMALLILGGEVIRGFSIALLIGVIVGTYSSIFVASPVILMLGISREDMIPVVKEGEGTEVDAMP